MHGDPVELSFRVPAENFDGLRAVLRPKLTPNSIFIETERDLSLQTRVRVLIEYQTGKLALSGGGSIADVREEKGGVLVAIEWEAGSRALVDQILATERSAGGIGLSWADALFSGRPSAVAIQAPPPPAPPSPGPTSSEDLPFASDDFFEEIAEDLEVEPPKFEPLSSSWTPQVVEPSFESVDVNFEVPEVELNASAIPSRLPPPRKPPVPQSEPLVDPPGRTETLDTDLHVEAEQTDDLALASPTDGPAPGNGATQAAGPPPRFPPPRRSSGPPALPPPTRDVAQPARRPPTPPPRTQDVAAETSSGPTEPVDVASEAFLPDPRSVSQEVAPTTPEPIRPPTPAPVGRPELPSVPAAREVQEPPEVPTRVGVDALLAQLDPRTASPAPAPTPMPSRPATPIARGLGPRPAKLEAGGAKLGNRGDAVIGIDLGTTYSCAAVVEKGVARVLASRQGKFTIPSAVYFDESGRTVVGNSALRGSDSRPERTIIGSKRLMGRPFHAPLVQQVRDHFAYDIVQGFEGEAAIAIDEQVIALEEIGAHILREIRESASLQIDGKLNRAVITCPAYFSERQREAVRVAGELAGFHVERVLSEPTAAALHYGFGKSLDGHKVLVYDLGGGTFDVSLLEVNGEVYEVLATGGDAFLGGIDFDACIAEFLAETFLEQTQLDARSDASAIARLLYYAEQAKRDLSTMMSTVVQVEHFVVQPFAARSMTVGLRRSRVEEMFDPLISRTVEIVREVCQRANVAVEDVDDILLVGGQTRTPIVQRRVQELFGKDLLHSVNPDQAVALGAAQYAFTLDSFDSIVLIDALPMAIGVGLPGGRFRKLIERDTRLPVQRRYPLRTTRDNQASIEVLVFQGESDWVRDNEPLGMLTIDKLPKRPRGAVEYELLLEVTEECILRLSAIDKKTGRKVEAQFGTKSTTAEIRDKLGLPEQPTHEELEAQRQAATKPKGVWKWLTGVFRKK